MCVRLTQGSWYEGGMIGSRTRDHLPGFMDVSLTTSSLHDKTVRWLDISLTRHFADEAIRWQDDKIATVSRAFISSGKLLANHLVSDPSCQRNDQSANWLSANWFVQLPSVCIVLCIEFISGNTNTAWMLWRDVPGREKLERDQSRQRSRQRIGTVPCCLPISHHGSASHRSRAPVITVVLHYTRPFNCQITYTRKVMPFDASQWNTWNSTSRHTEIFFRQLSKFTQKLCQRHQTK